MGAKLGIAKVKISKSAGTSTYKIFQSTPPETTNVVDSRKVRMENQSKTVVSKKQNKGVYMLDLLRLHVHSKTPHVVTVL